ncbi:hypothetical protein [Arthrobacter sp. B1805]|uniref:hypothetical protein n=1 Tax=Arthrobacter sp. B1805 TaxID=2058892 RepID=UPI000CE3AECB|nr:hypothetical protein [Arthrobacter sp. B1805]
MSPSQKLDDTDLREDSIRLIDAEQYSRAPYFVTWDLPHPRATVKPTGDGRWRAVLWEEPGVIMSDHVHAGAVTMLLQADAVEWATRIVGWERQVRR